MVAVTDVAPRWEESSPLSSGKTIKLRGLGARAIAVLLGKFPEARSLMVGREWDGDPTALIDRVPDGVVWAMGFASGHLDHPDWMEALADMSLADQVTVLEKVVELSTGGGFGPFVERLGALMGVRGGATSAAQVTTSQPQSSSSSQTDTPPTAPGTTQLPS